MMFFLGGGTLFSNIDANRYYYNDIDKKLTGLVELFAKNKPEKILNDIANYKYYPFVSKLDSESKRVNNEIYNLIKNEYNSISNKDSYDAKIILLILVIHSFNSQIRFNKNNNFNIPAGKQTLNNTRKKHLVDFSNTLGEKIINFSSLDFKKFIEKYAQSSKNDDFWYFDPPYLISNATYNQNWTSDNDSELFELLDWLNSKNKKWGLSNVFSSKGKENTALIKWSKKYKVVYIQKNYSNSNYQRKNRKKIDLEVYISNYEN